MCHVTFSRIPCHRLLFVMNYLEIWGLLKRKLIFALMKIDIDPVELDLGWQGLDNWWKTKKKFFSFVGSSNLVLVAQLSSMLRTINKRNFKFLFSTSLEFSPEFSRFLLGTCILSWRVLGGCEVGGPSMFVSIVFVGIRKVSDHHTKDKMNLQTLDGYSYPFKDTLNIPRFLYINGCLCLLFNPNLVCVYLLLLRLRASALLLNKVQIWIFNIIVTKTL